MRALISLILLVALGGVADAAKRAGVTMPDTIEVGGKRLQLNGLGLREASVLKVDVYVAGLYLETVSSDASAIISSPQTKRLVLAFVRDVDRSDIVKAWNEGFAKSANAKLPASKSDIDRLNSWMTDFQRGDMLTFTSVPGGGVEVRINRTVKGTIQSEEFARSLFAIWLGPNPPNQSLKKGLLGDHGG